MILFKYARAEPWHFLALMMVMVMVMVAAVAVAAVEKITIWTKFG